MGDALFTSRQLLKEGEGATKKRGKTRQWKAYTLFAALVLMERAESRGIVGREDVSFIPGRM